MNHKTCFLYILSWFYKSCPPPSKGITHGNWSNLCWRQYSAEELDLGGFNTYNKGDQNDPGLTLYLSELLSNKQQYCLNAFSWLMQVTASQHTLFESNKKMRTMKDMWAVKNCNADYFKMICSLLSYCHMLHSSLDYGNRLTWRVMSTPIFYRTGLFYINHLCPGIKMSHWQRAIVTSITPAVRNPRCIPTCDL